jgi:hypothetical protein
MVEDGYKCTEIRQGVATLSEPSKKLLELVMAGKLYHGGHPVLRYDADGLSDGSDDHRYRAVTVGQAVRSALQSRCHDHVLSIGKSGVVGSGVLLRHVIAVRGGRGGARLSYVARRAGSQAVRYAATVPGTYGDTIALVAELAIWFILMYAILFASDHEVLAPYAHYFAAILAAIYIAFESPLSGMSTNPARTFFGFTTLLYYWSNGSNFQSICANGSQAVHFGEPNLAAKLKPSALPWKRPTAEYS